MPLTRANGRPDASIDVTHTHTHTPRARPVKAGSSASGAQRADLSLIPTGAGLGSLLPRLLRSAATLRSRPDRIGAEGPEPGVEASAPASRRGQQSLSRAGDRLAE